MLIEQVIKSFEKMKISIIKKYFKNTHEFQWFFSLSDFFKWPCRSFTYFRTIVPCGRDLTKKECYSSLISFENSNSPGNDEITKELH